MLDVHAAAIAIAAQVADGSLTPAQSLAPILVTCSTSALAKIGFALAAGPRAFGWRVALAQMAIAGAAWAVAAGLGLL